MTRAVQNVCLLLLGTAGAGCGKQPLPPAPPNDFVSEVRFELLPDHTAIGHELRWTFGEGRFAEFCCVPRDDYPREYEGRTVKAPEDWPITLVLFRPGKKWSDRGTVWLGLTRYSLGQIGRPQKVLPLRHDRVGWHHARFPGDPPCPKYVTEATDKLYGWTFLALKPELTGEFVYEVLLFPTWTGTVVYYDLGPPVVLKRGLFRIDPRQE